MNKFELTQKYFNDVYSYNVLQLSGYNEYDGKRLFGIAFESLSASISQLKLKYGEHFESNFKYLEFTLKKINKLGTKPNTKTSKKLNLYIDYFELKVLELLEEIENSNIYTIKDITIIEEQ